MKTDLEIARLKDEVRQLSQVEDSARLVVMDLRCEIATFNELSPIGKFQLGVIQKYSNYTLMGLAQEADDFSRRVEDVIHEVYIDICYANPLAQEYVDSIFNPDYEDYDDMMNEPWFGEGCRE